MTPEIQDGDWLVIDRTLRPEANDIVLAQLGDSFTVKRHKLNDERGRGGLYLVPANELYESRKVSEADQFSICGVVTWILKPIR